MYFSIVLFFSEAHSTFHRHEQNSPSFIMSDNPKATTLNKAIFAPKKGHHQWDKEEFLDVIYWAHNILAIIFGLAWGYISLTGSFALISYMMTSSFLIVLYAAHYQDLDLEEFDGAWGIAKEGFIKLFGFFSTFELFCFNEI